MEKKMIDIPPAKLYALILKLRPLERGTLMPFSGELVHAAWLNWISTAAPDVATLLHEGNKRRLFTCSSLQFPLSAYDVQHAQQKNIHLPLEPQRTYTVRITLLLGELFSLFYDTLIHCNSRANWFRQPAFMQLGKQSFSLEEVIANDDDVSGWTGVTTFAQLVEQAQKQCPDSITLEFSSLTTFNWIHVPNKTYGNHYVLLPLPRYIFPGLAKRWQELVPPELAHVVQKELIEAYLEAEGAVIDDYQLQTHRVHFVAHPQRGFVGWCRYHLRIPEQASSSDTALTIGQQLLLLAQLAFYTGVGYKPTMGMGQVRLKKGSEPVYHTEGFAEAATKQS